jgi:hypothetical protein
MNAPPTRESRPTVNRAANISTAIKTLPILDDAADRRLTRWRPGCPCGCDGPESCLAGRPTPDVDPCCGRLGFSELAIARDRGWNCASGCVARRLGLVA